MLEVLKSCCAFLQPLPSDATPTRAQPVERLPGTVAGWFLPEVVRESFFPDLNDGLLKQSLRLRRFVENHCAEPDRPNAFADTSLDFLIAHRHTPPSHTLQHLAIWALLSGKAGPHVPKVQLVRRVAASVGVPIA